MKALVVGYGNTLRGDDGVGPWVAGRLAAVAPRGVRIRSVHQLMPELVDTLAEVELAIFVDAQQATTNSDVAVCRLRAEATPPPLEHAADPAQLLALTRALHARAPEAYLVTIPGASFEMGESLSPLAQTGATVALSMIQALLQGAAACLSA